MSRSFKSNLRRRGKLKQRKAYYNKSDINVSICLFFVRLDLAPEGFYSELSLCHKLKFSNPYFFAT